MVPLLPQANFCSDNDAENEMNAMRCDSDVINTMVSRISDKFVELFCPSVQTPGLTSLSESKIWQSEYRYSTVNTIVEAVELFGLPYLLFQKTS